MFPTRVLLGNPVKKAWKTGLLWKPQKWTQTRCAAGPEAQQPGVSRRAPHYDRARLTFSVVRACSRSQESKLAGSHRRGVGCRGARATASSATAGSITAAPLAAAAAFALLLCAAQLTRCFARTQSVLNQAAGDEARWKGQEAKKETN